MLYGNYRTRAFNDVYPSLEDFTTDFNEFSNVGLNPNFQGENTLSCLYYLLTAKYGNSHVANNDENQFRLKLFSTIFQYGPTWEKRLDIQNKLRALSETDLITGTTQINNHSYNPSTEPSTSTLDELITTNEQTSTKYKKDRMQAYSNLMDLLKTDVTEEFIKKFKYLFLVIVEPQLPLWYITNLNEGEEVF